MFVVGLTGGIGSGKSTVATLFAAKGIPIIDADEIARAITQPDKPALRAIIEIFGSNILLANGHLDRATLKKIVFSDPVLRKKLEDLLHPLIRSEMKSRIESLDAPYCILMIPLLLETAPNPLVKRILIVDTHEHLQVSRATLRDKITKEDVEAIMNTQINRKKRLEITDDVIFNDGKYEDLIPQIDKFHELYTYLATKMT